MSIRPEIREWIYSQPTKAETNFRLGIVERFGEYFSEFVDFMDDGQMSPKAKAEFAEISSNSNRFGVYNRSIHEVLNGPVRDEYDEAQNDAYEKILEGFSRFTNNRFPEFRVDTPNSALHLQTLAEFLSVYWSSKR